MSHALLPSHRFKRRLILGRRSVVNAAIALSVSAALGGCSALHNMNPQPMSYENLCRDWGTPAAADYVFCRNVQAQLARQDAAIRCEQSQRIRQAGQRMIYSAAAKSLCEQVAFLLLLERLR
jgi:hypothetical protein